MIKAEKRVNLERDRWVTSVLHANPLSIDIKIAGQKKGSEIFCCGKLNQPRFELQLALN